MAMYSGRATDAYRMARFRKTLAASAIDIGVFLHLYVYCGMFLWLQQSWWSWGLVPRSRTEIGSGPVFLDCKLSFNKAQAMSVLTKRNRHAFSWKFIVYHTLKLGDFWKKQRFVFLQSLFSLTIVGCCFEVTSLAL